MLFQFPITFSTAGLNNGVAIYSPTPGDILLDAWIEVDTAFNGTTPKADIGDFTLANTGWFADADGPQDLAAADSPSSSGPLLLEAATAAGIQGLSLIEGSAKTGFRITPGKLTGAGPVKVVVSQTGLKGGAAVGGTQGAAVVFLLVATPL